jgi:hypothetical protein
MRSKKGSWRIASVAGGFLTVVCAVLTVATRDSKASIFDRLCGGQGCKTGCCAAGDGHCGDEVGGTWYWMRSPDDEKRVVMGLFNRYCIRCHGVDGRGVWDIPGVPDFTNVRWQASRSDAQLARIIMEGRGAVMPPFRGALNLEEAWVMARYLRTFVPGTEASRPDLGQPEKTTGPAATSLPTPSTPAK